MESITNQGAGGGASSSSSSSSSSSFFIILQMLVLALRAPESWRCSVALFSVQARNFATIQSVTGSLLRSVLQSTLTPWTSKTSIFKAKGKPFTISSLLYGQAFRATSFVLNFSKGSVVARRLLLTFLVDLSRLLRIQKRATNKMVGFWINWVCVSSIINVQFVFTFPWKRVTIASLKKGMCFEKCV